MARPTHPKIAIPGISFLRTPISLNFALFTPNRAHKSRISLLKIYSAKAISFGSIIHYVKGFSMTENSRTTKRSITPEEHFCSFNKT
jgi:hypothetical protein